MTLASRLTIQDEYLGNLQRRIATISVLAPFFGTLIALALLLWGQWTVGLPEIGSLIAMYVLTMFGVSTGFHRLFAHVSFKAGATVTTVLGVLGSMAAQGPLIHWVANHRRHHAYSDIEGDPHSPNLLGRGFPGGLRGFWNAHMGWLFSKDVPNPVLLARDLLQDPLVLRINKYYSASVLLGLAIPATMGLISTGEWRGAVGGLLWGGFVRIFLMHHATWSINSVTHLFGRRPFDTGDHSANIGWLALLTGGEGWHNNHHAFPNSAFLGLEWWEIDVGSWPIRALARARLVRDVNVPSSERRTARRLRRQDERGMR